ncbi:maleylacetate reductase [Roseomonas sp. SSH11]|uniref:Maleylacetate reductase n=1 Tax=Pararoseomonas baculiformis TaxID=2820812 RepID=A0ABS4AEU6_9PROT|nr:maleylacetate reductase [Pararoseomonas baculiformis]MBP0445529.1 maleylacetate reductase [Pararoseomonas baculiformis]
MRAFTHAPLPQRVVFGAESLGRLPAELDAMGLRRVLVLSTPGQRALGERVLALIGARGAGLHAEARMHVPVEVAEAASVRAAALGADAVLAVGGGSAIGLAKAVALSGSLPALAVPTTYSGSECTAVWGLTRGGAKSTGRDPRVLPALVLYDPTLTLDLPPGIAAVSGLNAIAHAVEVLYAPDGTPVTAIMAEEGVRALAAALPRIREEPRDAEARAEALYGAWLCGTVLGQVTMGLHHKLCHALGGGFDLPHAETHAVILPHAAAYNAPAAPEAMARIARALGAEDAPGGLWALAGRLGAARSLAELGLREADLPRALSLATASPYPNPRPVTEAGLAALLARALAGEPPLVEKP